MGINEIDRENYGVAMALNGLMTSTMLTPVAPARTAASTSGSSFQESEIRRCDTLAVMPGLSGIFLPTLSAVAREFGWKVESVSDLSHAIDLSQTHGVAAIFFHRDAFGPQCSWTDALELLATALPGARLIPCHGFSEPVDWSQLSDAGAFHFLWLPLKESELRQCVGFVWQTQQRTLQSAPTLSEAVSAASAPARALVPVQSLPPERASRKTALTFTYTAA